MPATTTDPDQAPTDFDWTTIQRITGGFRIKTNTAGTHYVDVLLMIVNWRIALTPVDDPDGCYVRFWCYEGNDLVAWARAVAAAIKWDGALDTEPEGWRKNGQTGAYQQAAGVTE